MPVDEVGRQLLLGDHGGEGMSLIKCWECVTVAQADRNSQCPDFTSVFSSFKVWGLLCCSLRQCCSSCRQVLHAAGVTPAQDPHCPPQPHHHVGYTGSG